MAAITARLRAGVVLVALAVVVAVPTAAAADAPAPSEVTPAAPAGVTASVGAERSLTIHPRPAIATAVSARPVSTSRAVNVASSPDAAASFAGIEGDGTTFPADVTGAVGPDHVVQATSSAVRVSTKAGVTVSETSLLQWWQTFSPAIEEVGDPALTWEPAGARFVFAASVDRGAPDAGVVLAVSRTSDPTGDWWMVRVGVDGQARFDASSTRVGSSAGWITVAVDRSGLDDGAGAGSLILGFGRAEAEDGDADMTFARVVEPGKTGVAPVGTADPGISPQYLVSDDGDGSRLTVGRLIGPLASARYRPRTATVTGVPWSTTGVDAPQQGSAVPVETGDTRIQNCTLRNASLWCSQTVFLPASDPTRVAVQWWQFLPDGTVLQQGRVNDTQPSDGVTFVAFPSIAVNAAGDVLLGYARFSASSAVSGAYRFRSVADPVGTMREEVVMAPGDAPYVDLDGGGVNRWGDTSATAVDPSDGSLWTAQAAAAAPSPDGDRWRTWWARVDPPPEGGADVAASISNAPPRSLVGRVADVDLVAVANGPSGPTGVTIGLDAAPDGRVVTAPSVCDPVPGGVACAIGSLDRGEVARLSVGVRIRSAGDVDLRATVTSDADPNTSNDTAAAVIQGLDATTCTRTGTAGNDQLFGTGGTDVLCALGGDDVVYPSGGEDLVLGGDGFDYVAFADVQERARIDLGAQRASVGGDRVDLVGFEGAFGGPRRDVLLGGSGGDVLTGLGGDDRIDGGPGSDTVSYYSCAGNGCAASDVVVNLTTGVGRGEDAGTDTLRRIEHVYGSLLGDDRLIGNAAPNLLYGFGGRDDLLGLSDDDYLSGGDGADRLEGGAGDDVLSGGPGSDVCRGGPGTTTKDTCP